MIRKQLYIDEDLDRALKVLAARTGRPEAEHVREALRAYLTEELTPPDHDPLMTLVALVDAAEGPRDVAERHDHYLYLRPEGPA